MEHKPLIFVAFGITGDLMRHKILPAIFALHSKGEVSEIVRIVGISRQEWDTLKLQEYVAGVIRETNPSLPEVSKSFLDLFYFQHGDVENPEAMETFAQALNVGTPCNTLFYLSIAPNLFEATLKQLSQLHVFTEKNPDTWTRIIVEKPFGHNLESALALNAKMHELFPEENIYRADHYLQKALPREMLAFRLSHKDIAALWNKEHIASIHIRLWETIGVEKRGVFYDQTGALRDVGQNHILQLLGLITMKQPTEGSAIQEDRAEILGQLYAPEDFERDTLRAQYKTYTEEVAIPTSKTETYFSIQTHIVSDVWKSVLIELDAGKELPRVEKYIEVQFIHPESIPVNGTSLEIRAIQFQLGEKQEILLIPAAGTPVSIWSATASHAEYENVILDAIASKRDFFVSTEEVLASWRFIDPITESWKKNVPELELYEKGKDPFLPS